jgi:glycosyltransferase involved in cell wall biosynthesis
MRSRRAERGGSRSATQSAGPAGLTKTGTRPQFLLARMVARLGRLSLRALTAIRVLLGGVILLLLLCLRTGVFDAAYYRKRYGFSRLVQLSPLLEFSFRGAWALRDPSPYFAQHAYSAARPWTMLFPPILHALLYGAGDVLALHDEQQVATPAEAAAEPTMDAKQPMTPERRLLALWPALEADMRELMDVASALTPNDRLQTLLLQRCRPAPAVHAASVVQRLMARLPVRVEHLVVVPWLGIAGGSERVTQRLLKRLGEHYADGGVCVLAPDAGFDLNEEEQDSFGVPIVALNDLDHTLSGSARVELLDRVLVELRPATVHSINSDTAWQAFRDHGRYYARDCGLYGNIYSDFRYPDGTPVGIFWRYLPECLPHMAGIIADNRKVISRAQQCFGLLPEQMARFRVVPTPVLGMMEEERCRPYRPGRGRHSLWMSRIGLEKRVDVLREIALRCSERQFSIYGAMLPNSVPDDYLDWMQQLPNVRQWGRFEALSALPIEDYDSYIFTTSAEGMPIALMEATMLGLPTVAPDVGGIGEFIDADTGWLVRGPDDVDGYVAALAEIEADPVAAGRRVAAAQARLQERHSWTSFCRSLAAIPGYLQPRSR